MGIRFYIDPNRVDERLLGHLTHLFGGAVISVVPKFPTLKLVECSAALVEKDRHGSFMAIAASMGAGTFEFY